ncbi:MAG: DUF2784 domain-containing protein [Bacteroidetes bacterium]|nr:DUF2784 domain-containing protein [Bacteroidota bacterium]
MADFVLFIHFVFVLFIVGGLVLIWVGFFRHWTWIRNIHFRRLHLTAMAVVAFETLFGISCPLTDLESWLRTGQESSTKGFISYWIDRLMFYSAPEYIFTVLYMVLLVFIVFTFIVVKPISTDHKSTL